MTIDTPIAEKAPEKSGAFDAEKAAVDRDALGAEWLARNPQTPEEIAEFYRTCSAELVIDDLDNFHDRPFRKRFSETLRHIVGVVTSARVVIDIGAGAGHDLAMLTALSDESWALTDEDGVARLAVGVEPNDELRERIAAALRIPMFSDVSLAPIESADVLNCIDVLEHVPNPEPWLDSIARRAKLGCYLIETCSTFDLGTPLHLASNRGWHPGRCLERNGWARLGEENTLRIWIKAQEEPICKSTLVICSGREISGETFDSMLAFVGEPGQMHWRVSRASENGLLRARSIWVSKWWRETNGDVFVFVDSDIKFTPLDVEWVSQTARENRCIAVAAYSVRDGGHLALRGRADGPEKLLFGPDRKPIPIEYGATGFMAVHRDVIDAMIPTLKLCHANQPWALWPLFDFNVVEDEHAGGWNWLSEDWEFCRRAKELGFDTYLDPRPIIEHFGGVPFTVLNMTAIQQAVQYKPSAQTIEQVRQEVEGDSTDAPRRDEQQPANRAERRKAKRRRNGNPR